jgi:peptidoglycan/LPS O-acetylase OafA/YrhL
MEIVTSPCARDGRVPGVSVRHDKSTDVVAAEGQGSEASILVPGARSSSDSVAASVAPATTDPAPRAREKKPGRLHALDLLRFLAAISVVVYHYTARGRGWHTPVRQLFPMLHVVSQYGWMGVELFFLISGFVICMSSWGRGVGTYFASRVSRLFPAYLFAAMLTASVVAVWPGFSLNTNNENILLNFTMVEVPLGGRPIDSVYWTLLAELLFYLLFALVVWRGLTYQRAVAFCVLWTMASIVVPMFAGKFAGVVFQPEYSPYFIAGIAFYLMYRFGPNLLLCCIVGVSYILATHQIQTDVQAQATVAGNYLNETVVDAVLAVCFGLVALVALGRLSWIHGKWTVVLGTVTYPLYLIHQAIGFTVISRLDRHLNRYVLLIGLILAMIGAAWLIYRIIEKNIGPKVRRALTNSLRVPADLR